jgi:two-component system, cell cycle sensor histidine kinase and response regulator CckA
MNQDGHITGFIGTVDVISESQQSGQGFLISHQLKAQEIVAQGIAHNFNNLLTAILGSISIAKFALNDRKIVDRNLTRAESAALRARDLIKQLLAVTNSEGMNRKVIKLEHLLCEAAAIAVQDPKYRCEITVDNNIWPAEVDDGKLGQVIYNLLENAVQAMPEGGTIKIVAKNVFMSEKAGFVEISITDSGAGIPEHYLEKIFDLFFTTKPQSAGFGLTFCNSIINKHGGYIKVTSCAGKGSTFQLYLPAMKNPMDRHQNDHLSFKLNPCRG